MNIYIAHLSDNYSFFSADSLDNLKKIENKDYSNINGTNISLITNNCSNTGDITVLDSSCLLLFSEKAKKVFKSESFIPIPQINGYYLLDAPIIDALDTGKSVIDYFSGTTRLKRIRKHVFKKSMLENTDVFLLPIIASSVYVTDSFIKKYSYNNLTGLDFSLVN